MIPRVSLLPKYRQATQRERSTIREFIAGASGIRNLGFWEVVLALFSDDASHHHPDCQCSVCSFEGFGRYGVEERP